MEQQTITKQHYSTKDQYLTELINISTVKERIYSQYLLAPVQYLKLSGKDQERSGILLMRGVLILVRYLMSVIFHVNH